MTPMHSPREGYPSCLHTTAASLLSQLVSQTVPHLPSTQISTLPSCTLVLPLRRIEPPLHCAKSGRKNYVDTDGLIVFTLFVHLPLQLTPASSLCPQLETPTSALEQSSSLDSPPLHATSSMSMGPPP